MILTGKRLQWIFSSLADYQNHWHSSSLRALISSLALQWLLNSKPFVLPRIATVLRVLL